MAFELTSENQVNFRPALRYDAESVKLVGHFRDEISAYRARRKWMQAFNEFFMLDRNRDYSIGVKSSCSNGKQFFELECCFKSACGRYAFWRLINRQAPEVEHQLGLRSNRPTKQDERLLSAILGKEIKKSPSWVITCKPKEKTFRSFLSAALRKFSCW